MTAVSARLVRLLNLVPYFRPIPGSATKTPPPTSASAKQLRDDVVSFSCAACRLLPSDLIDFACDDDQDHRGDVLGRHGLTACA